MPRPIRHLLIVKKPGHPQMGTLIAGQSRFSCALGRSGVIALKREGDGGTPRSILPIRRVFYRADHINRPPAMLKPRPIRRDDAWCDDHQDRRYNRLIRLPPGFAEERLWRNDHLYDVVVELGWNDSPVQKGRGSAIFWHLARPGLTPTAGCVAVSIDVFRKVLPRLARQSFMVIR